ncbi:MAG: protein kinase domain-containing protein [Myxococcota bacterium]
MSDDPKDLEPTLRSPSTPAKPSTLPPLDEARYRVETAAEQGLLGQGGQGSVWRARDEVLRREVALKRLHRGGDAAAESAFMREARLTALLEHPGIVPVHDLGRAADGAAALVMRRIEGRSLAERLAEAPTLEARLAFVPALLRACQTVAFAHERHVVHRDLKPHNIMLGAFGETYVLDWGVAVMDAASPGEVDITGPSSRGGIVGSPAYMSPEQALGLAADARSDVWGLGGCLYQLLTGQPPLAGRNVLSAVRHAAAGEVAPVRALEPAAPADLVAICEKALAPERSQRYASALELSKDLEAWVAGRTVSARTYTLAELLWRTLKTHRALAGVIAAALLTGLVGLAVEEARVRRERNDARSFARELLRDIPRQAATQKPSLELLGLLSSRARAWLARRDFSDEERVDACALLTQLGTLNSDAQQFDEAERLARQALDVAIAGAREHPAVANFVACEASAHTLLGDIALEQERAESGLQHYAAAEARLDAWRGAPDSSLALARAALNHSWGEWLWTRAPAEGARRFVLASDVALTLVDDPDPWVRRSALGYSFNGTTARWSQGRRADARELARRFYEAARPTCEGADNSSQRSCLSALTAWLVFLSWDAAPEYDALLARALAIEAQYLERNADSTTALYDSMLFALERGDFATASRRAVELRPRAPAWADELGPLAAALAGQLDVVDSWQPIENDTTGPLALALTKVARGHHREAAAQLRRIDRARLWYELSWAPRPVLGLSVPGDVRPAFDAFLRDFTRAYGDADFAALGEALEAFARELERR